MSQRRGGTQKEPAVAVEEETIPFGEVFDPPAGALTMDRTMAEKPVVSAGTSAPLSAGTLSLEARYESEAQALRLKQWKEGHFAAGMTAATWGDEYQKWRHNFREQCMSFDESDGVPCGCCSAAVCGVLGAGRVGNMAVLKQSTEWVEEDEEDENGEVRTRRFTRPRLDVVVGPVSNAWISKRSGGCHMFALMTAVFLSTFSNHATVVLANALHGHIPIDFWSVNCNSSYCNPRKANDCDCVLGCMHIGADLFIGNDRVPGPWHSFPSSERATAIRRHLEME